MIMLIYHFQLMNPQQMMKVLSGPHIQSFAFTFLQSIKSACPIFQSSIVHQLLAIISNFIKTFLIASDYKLQ